MAIPIHVREVDGHKYGTTQVLKFYHRRGIKEQGSDLDAFNEVVERRAYRRVRDRFDVEPLERWLDLGANVGAFAFYCRLRGATADCYEPMPDCFRILKKNVGRKGFGLHNAAVTEEKTETIAIYSSKNPDNHYRGTVTPVQGYIRQRDVVNMNAGFLVACEYDGVKMDIEGAEGPIIDAEHLPKCKKLVMEYHTSRDSSVAHLHRRLEILKAHFNRVHYPRAYDLAISEWSLDKSPDGPYANYRPRFDQLIYCWEPR